MTVQTGGGEMSGYDMICNDVSCNGGWGGEEMIGRKEGRKGEGMICCVMLS